MLSNSATVYTATAIVPTKSAGRYLQQLCKHWSHNLAVAYTAKEGTITFPKDLRGNNYPDDATITLEAHETSLNVLLHASTREQLDDLKGPVASHLDRFAFREAPLAFDWR